MKNDLYWIWLTSLEDVSTAELNALVEVYGSAADIYERESYDEIQGLSEKALDDLLYKCVDDAEVIIEKIDNMGGRVMTWEDDDYPRLLRELYDPPYVLYVKGESPDWDKILTIGVVGTRICTDYGLRATEKITRDLAKAGVVIVSGMARGIDSAANKMAVECGTPTIAVLGSGLDVIYPAENKWLYDAICKNGMVMTEYPPGTRPLKQNFPKRNRIMAGLSYGVLVAQAPEKSGALITAQYAVNNNRDVFVIPADMFNVAHLGSNKLIQSGAKLILSADDIIDEYPYFDFKSDEDDTDIYSGLSEPERKIVDLLGKGALYMDDIVRALNLSQSEITTAMLMLEMNGVIKRYGAGQYRLAY